MRVAPLLQGRAVQHGGLEDGQALQERDGPRRSAGGAQPPLLEQVAPAPAGTCLISGQGLEQAVSSATQLARRAAPTALRTRLPRILKTTIMILELKLILILILLLTQILKLELILILMLTLILLIQ